MYISFATHIHVTRIAAMRIIFTHIGCTLLPCDMYMCRERHTWSGTLILKDVRYTFTLFLFTVSLPPTTHAPTRAYVKRMKDNETRHVIHDTRISSGQCPRRDVTVRYGLQGHTEYTPEERHIHVKKGILCLWVRVSWIDVNNCPKRCDYIQFIIFL
jgi:hypothetical protein